MMCGFEMDYLLMREARMNNKVISDDPIWFVHYGHNQYNPNEFRIATNSNHYPFKPIGGLWGCLVDGKKDWKEWCINNEFKLDKYSKNNCFYFRIESSKNMLTISTKEDYDKLPKRSINIGNQSLVVVDYEKLMDEGIGDGYNIYALNIDFDDMEELSECFPGYDCNCVIVLDDCIIFENRTMKEEKGLIVLSDLLPMKWVTTILGDMELSKLLSSPDGKQYFYLEQPDQRYGFKTLVASFYGDIVENRGFSANEIECIMNQTERLKNTFENVE